MFFPERIVSIKPTDRVLEIGPGGTPYYRSDIFLELIYDDPNEFKRQRADVGELVTDKQVVYYDGNIFPFQDKEFDYVVCSHVLEHVPDVPFFLSELMRVSKKGYLEFPTIYYDYVYNIPEHVNILMYRNGIINWVKKKETNLPLFAEIQSLFFKSLHFGKYAFINELQEVFVQGFEWENKIEATNCNNLSDFTFSEQAIKFEEKIVVPYTPSFKDKVKAKLKILVDKI